MYEVIIEKSALKELQKISKQDYHKIKSVLLTLIVDPRPHGYLKLKGREGYRIRVGNYRIIYEIIDDKLMVIVITISHRKDVYE